MKKAYLVNGILFGLGCLQFLVVPIFSSMALGGKVVLFSIITLCLLPFLFVKKNEFDLSKTLIPLVVLAAFLLISLTHSKLPFEGIDEYCLYALGLMFSISIVNLSKYTSNLKDTFFAWFRIVGSVTAILCVYQRIVWILYGQSSSMLISYLLPPSSGRVSGVYGQPNLTALFLLLSMLAFLYDYILVYKNSYRFEQIFRNIFFFLITAAFFSANSRSGLIAFVFVVLLVFLLVRNKHVNINRKKIITIFSMLLAGFLFSQFPLSTQYYLTRYVGSGISVEARFVFWTAAILIFTKAPFLGVGLDHYKLFLPESAREAHDILGFVQYESMGYTNWAHNEYLQVLAESGIIGFLCLFVFLFLLTRVITLQFLSKKSDIAKSILSLMLVSFFIQGLFSWPFRHPALLPVFFMILGLFLADTPSIKIRITNLMQLLCIFFIICSFSVITFFSIKEYQYLQLKKLIIHENYSNKEIFLLINDPYFEFRALHDILPLCIKRKDFFNDLTQVKLFKPYFEKIAHLQGTYDQWYNLGYICKILGEYEQADEAFQKSVEMQPTFDRGWFELHALHIENAVRKTGRPIEEFLPPPDKIYSADLYKSFFK